ncbi:MAG: DUF1573 domain-containing protein [Crocinitomicaceae bacterium]
MKTGRSLLLVSILLMAFPIIGYSHPNNGELLCFEKSNFDVGEVYLNDRPMAFFVFENCSHDTVLIERIQSNSMVNRPFGWHAKYDKKPILPRQKDTIRFYRNFSFQTAGLYDQGFTVSYKNSEVKQQLNIFVELKHNAGKLITNPIRFDTLNKGTSVLFSIPIFNEGTDPIEISPRDGWNRSHIVLYDSFPKIILPNQQTNLTAKLLTSDLCQTYRHSLSFYSNEETNAYQNMLNIGYSGVLNTVNEAVISFDSLVLSNYINKGEVCVFDFNFTNTGDIPLIIAYAKTSCGCLVATYPKEPILPGQKGIISVRYDSKRVGPINKSITLQTNACKETTVLRVKGFVKFVNKNN